MKKSLIALLILTTVLQLQAQTPKKQLGWDDIESWRRITETVLSNDGNFVAYKSEPWLGDPVVKVYDKKGVEKGSWISASGVRFTDDSKHLLFTVKPSYEKVRELKMSKAKREDMPPDTLMIWSVDGKVEKIPGIRSFDVLSKKGNWIAYQAEPSKKTTEGQPEKKESAANGYTLYLKELNTGKLISIPFVTQYKFATVGEIAYFVSTGDNDKLAAGLYVYDFVKGEQRAIKEGKGDYRQVTFNTSASSIAFLFNGNDTDKLLNSFTLWYGPLSGMAVEIGKKGSLPIPTGWIISPNGRVSFSDSGNRLFFATAPEVRQKDTTRLEEDVPNVDIWHWNEPVLHTQQVVDRNADARASYMAVYNIESGTFAQLATPEVPDITLIKKGDYNLALAVSTLPYSVESMWEATPGRSDVYFIDLNSGKKELVKKGFRGRIQPSPEGKYLYWYAIGDSSWYSISLSDKREFRLTTPSNIMAADETNDIPNPASSYSIAGWVTDDKAILLYDRYDIWKVDPQNGYAPVRVTTDGREKSIVYRVIKLDSEKTSFDAAEDLFLSGHNDITRGEGYYTISLTKPGVPSVVLSGLYSLTTPQKASGANTVVFAKQTFQTFPDLLLTDVGFKKHIKISDVNPQQNDFSWGTAEVVSWVSLDGMEIEGLLFKPDNFDPTKKYPMIVNFYEKSSQELFNYKNPELHRSTIDYHYYTSNGYVVFNPDVYYREGYPGESAFNCVMPGITGLIARGFIDPARIAASGHSWGGYQVAYMATRTNLFACIESGAAVVNMFSAYGGIRWATGLNRSFQYEHTQSRIGLSIWESPLRYLENSPLFTMDKVETPILIMANDQDGHVPWYQGIEFFTALRRLRKPAWMLNYTGEPHWPTKIQNKKDFQIRMGQFFDHYLKDKPMPLWMKEGIPAVDKDFELGYRY